MHSKAGAWLKRYRWKGKFYEGFEIDRRSAFNVPCGVCGGLQVGREQ